MGKIILLNTPIGNLGDLTPRVFEALRSGETFAVEDTRVFKQLLNHLGISVSGKKVFSLHDQSEKNQLEKLISLLASGDLYVVSEAGSPIVSDPAYPLVVAAYQKGVEVDSFSGVSSPIMALELSGLPPIPFQFHGFVPRESGKRAKIFMETVIGTHIFFEAPTRIEETLNELCFLMPGTPVALVRELSKKFQQVERFNAKDWPQVKTKITFRGEFILLFHREKVQGSHGSEFKELAQEILANEGKSKALAKLLALILERPTKEIYSELARQKRNK